MIPDEKAESAVLFYAKTGMKMGEARGAMEAAKHEAKTLEKLAFVELEGTGTVAEREAKAMIDPRPQAAWNSYHNLVCEYETLRTQLKGAELTIEVWRSQNSARNRGHV